MTFSCTKKVLDKLKEFKLISDEVEEPNITNWYVNWITMYRKRFALVVNSQTYFSFLVYVGRKKELKSFEDVVQKALVKELNKLSDIEPFNTLKFLQLNREAKFTRTNSRTVIGQMNDFKNIIECYILNPDYMEEELSILNDKINQFPIKKIKYKNPKEEMIRQFKLVNQ